MSEEIQPPGGPVSPDPLSAFGGGGAGGEGAAPPSGEAPGAAPLPDAMLEAAGRPVPTPPPEPPPSPPPPVVAAPPPPRGEPYPMRFDVAYPERLSRWKTFFRGILVIPVYLFAYLVAYIPFSVFFAARTTIFFRRKYPRWLFAAGSGYLAWTARFGAYGLLLTDRYPSFDHEEGGPVSLDYDDPLQGQLSRWRGLLWRLTLLIPHFIVLYFLQLAVLVVTVLAWFAILFTGRYPRGMFGFTTGVMRWHYRVFGYLLQFNDRFPPFALSAEAGPAAPASTVICGTIGALILGAFSALIAVGIAIGNDPHVESARYADLQNGRSPVPVVYSIRSGGTITLTLARIYDPGDDLAKVLTPLSGSRLVVFEWTVRNASDTTADFDAGSATLRLDRNGDSHTIDVELVTVGGSLAPAGIGEGKTGQVRAVFVVPRGEQPVHLRFHPDFGRLAGIKYVFE